MKIIQISTSVENYKRGETYADKLCPVIYGLGDDGELYMFNHSRGEWEQISV